MRNYKGLIKYILIRLLLLLLSFFVIFTICFFLIRVLPNNYQTSVGQDEAMYERMNSVYGWDKPVIVQYGIYLKNLFFPYYKDEFGVWQEVSRFGYSWKVSYLGKPDEILLSRFPPTVIINVYSMIISIPIGLFLGIFMALHKNKWQDYVLNILIMICISVPSFIYAFLLQYIFAFKLNLVPIVMPALEKGMTWFSSSIQVSMILPVVAISIGSIASFARYTRAELSESMSNNYMLLGRMKGLSKTEIVIKHGLRNSMVIIFPMILGEFISILSGLIIIEQIFGIPGVGRIFLDSIIQRDYDLFLYVGMFYTFIGLIGGLIVDVSYGLIDPRIRIGGKKVNE